MIEGVELWQLTREPGKWPWRQRAWWLSAGSEPGLVIRPNGTSAVRSRWLCVCGLVAVVHFWRRGT